MLNTLRRKLAGWISPGDGISRSLPPEVAASALFHGWASGSTGTGPAIGERNALTIPAVWAAVSCYTSTIGALSLYVAERDSRGGRRPAPDHWAYDLLSLKPNRRSTSMRLRQAWVGHAATRGNGYIEIEWDARGREAKALHLMDPADTEPVEVGDTVVYRSRSNRAEDLPAEDVLHLAMFGWDGVRGYSPIGMGHETLGVAAKQRTYQAGLFDNSAQASGHLEVPAKMTTPQKNELRTFWNQTHQGPENAGNVGILDAGAKWVQTSFSPQDAELILGCKFSVEEIARLWNLPPYKLGLPDTSGKTGEEQSIEFYQTSILPWLCAIEQELDLKLLGRIERMKYFVYHDAQILLRGNIAAEAAREQGDLSSGVRTINEVRAARGLEPSDEEYADQLMIPTNNLTALKDIGKPIPAPPEATQPAVSRPRVEAAVPEPAAKVSAGAIRSATLDVVARMARREGLALRRAAGKDRLDLWLDDFYAKHVATFAEALAPAARLLAESLGGTVDPANLAGEWAHGSREALRSLYTTTPPAEMPGAVEKLCRGWESGRVESFVDYVVGRVEP